MSAGGYVNSRFMEYVLYGEIHNANPKIALYKKGTGSGSLVKHKSLETVCLPADISGGVRIVCTAADTSQDEYTVDAFAITRTPFTVDGVTSDVVMIHYVTVSKTRDQRLDVDLIAEITA